MRAREGTPLTWMSKAALLPPQLGQLSVMTMVALAPGDLHTPPGLLALQVSLQQVLRRARAERQLNSIRRRTAFFRCDCWSARMNQCAR